MYEQKIKFVARDGNEYEGTLINKYMAFEGVMRYIIKTELREHRCEKNEDGVLVEKIF